jgi:Ca2+-binding RTX toxin-like protein
MATVKGTQYDDKIILAPIDSGVSAVAGYWKGSKFVPTPGNSSSNSADIITGGNGLDYIEAGAGHDQISGGNGKDTVKGGAGDDIIWGDDKKNLDTVENGADVLYGDAGDDVIYGGNGPDWIKGGADDDVLTGGNGPDVFAYTDITDSEYVTGAAGVVPANLWTSASGSSWELPWDVVVEFVSGSDKIDLDNVPLTSLTATPAPAELTWSAIETTDFNAGQTDAVRGGDSLAYRVWTDVDGNFLYADTNGDGAADMKIQVQGVGAGDIIGINLGPEVTSNGTATVSENILTTAVVHDVNATDADGDNLTYSIVGGADAALLTIDADDGEIRFNASPDHESPDDVGANNVYNITVRVSDGISFSDQAISITVNDLDEVAPEFTSATTATAIDENSGAGQLVYTAAATDPAEDGPSNPVSYSFGGGTDDALFSINAATGAVTLAANPDDETKGSYSFDVTATDGAGNATTQTVTLEVNDLNAAPEITSGDIGSVIENALNTVVVYTAAANDDGENNNTLSFSLSGDDAAQFDIDEDTGEVRFLASQDFENPSDLDGDNIYDINIEVSDGDLTDSKAIQISVTDVNEGPPPEPAVASNDIWVISDDFQSVGLPFNIPVNWLTNNDTGTGIYVSAVTEVGGDIEWLTPIFSGGQLTGIQIDDPTVSSGTFTLSYTLNGAAAGTSTGTVTLNVINTTTLANSGMTLEGNDFSFIDLLSGHDSITGDPVLTGNAGIDTFYGSNNDDVLKGEAGNDFLYGNDNKDELWGGEGDDVLVGGNNDDLLIGGAGNDTLTGGNANDVFRFNLTTDGIDNISDFSVVDDTIQFDNASFTAIGANGTLSAGAFHFGTLATQDADDRITYDNTTGGLFYDADGSGIGSAVQVAQMSTGLLLTNNDFVII